MQYNDTLLTFRIFREHPAGEKLVAEDGVSELKTGSFNLVAHPAARFGKVGFADVVAGIRALFLGESRPIVLHDQCQAVNVGISRLVLTANRVDPDERAARRKDAAAIDDERNLLVTQKMVERIACQHDVGRFIWLAAEELSQIASNHVGSVRPDSDVVTRTLHCRIGDVHAAILFNSGFSKRVCSQPRIAAAEINNPQRLLLFPSPFGQRCDQFGVSHVVPPDHGIVHRPLLECLFDAKRTNGA